MATNDPQMSTPRPHVLIRNTSGATASQEILFSRARTQFRGENEVGRTAHLIVYSDGSAAGNAAAQAVLASAEADYSAVQGWFGGINLPAGQEGDDQNTPRTATPIQVLMDPQAGGAYHFGCAATDLYIQPDQQEATGLMVAELVEVFQAAINNGWSCGQANGEALSRALAVERNSSLAPLITDTAKGWWANGRVDYVTNNNADDRNQDSNGCGTLFLYYLHGQLGYDWTKITTTGGSSLGDCYQRLTGQPAAQGFQDFLDRLATLDQGGALNLPANGNPFPIGGVATPPSGSGGSSNGGGNGGLTLGGIGLAVLLIAVLGILYFTGAIGH